MSTLKFIRAEQRREAAAVVRRAGQRVVDDQTLFQAVTWAPEGLPLDLDPSRLLPACRALEKAKRKTCNGRSGAVVGRLLRLQRPAHQRAAAARRQADDARHERAEAAAARRASL